MLIKGNEYGFAFDMLTVIELCETLGIEEVNELYEKINKAFSSEKVTVGQLKITIALILTCANRWAEREEKNYSLRKDDIVAMTAEEQKEAVSEVIKVLYKSTPKEDKKKEAVKELEEV